VKYFWIGAILALAAVGPNIFPAAQAGHSTLHVLAMRLLLPSILGLTLISVAIWRSQRALSRAVFWGAVAGMLATIPLEVVRLAGFHFGYMPGNLPRLMGVLLLDRFAEGPSTASDIAGWIYHVWNGAGFGIIYAVLLGTRRRWLGALYGLLIGIGFMVSPVVKSLGVGYFGLQSSYGFPVTVTLAHLGFGLALGFLARYFLAGQPSTLSSASAPPCPSCIGLDSSLATTRRV
jgi:hypothetical protein